MDRQTDTHTDTTDRSDLFTVVSSAQLFCQFGYILPFDEVD
jgi:hypothetical protein